MGLKEMSGGKGPESTPNPTSQSTDSNGTTGSTNTAAGTQPGGDPSQGSGTGGEVKLAAWTQQVSKEIRENPELARELAPFEKLDDLVKAHIEQKKKSAIPGKDAKPEDVAAFWKQLGYPEKPEGYQLARDKTAGTFLAAAHAARLTDEQASALWKEVSSNQAQAIAAQKAAHQADLANTMDGLRKEYGDKFNYAVEMFDRAMGNTGTELSPLMNQLFGAGLLGNQTIIKAFIALGEARHESGSPPTSGSPGDPNKSVTEGGWYNYKK